MTIFRTPEQIKERYKNAMDVDYSSNSEAGFNGDAANAAWKQERHRRISEYVAYLEANQRDPN